MTRLSERIAADVLKASGSGLQNYTMNGARERIIEAASVADDLLEALQKVVSCFDIKDGLSVRDEQVIKHAASVIHKATGAAS